MIDGQTSLTDVAHWRQFCTDAAQDPTLLDRDPEGILSATLEGLEFARARYERVTRILAERFGSLDDLRILEVGAGYGGQALSIFSHFDPAWYYLVDLPEPFALQEKLLTGLRAGRWRDESFDVFVSSFALSELRRDLQLDWLRTASHARRGGFIYWNGWLAGEVTLEETVEILSARADVEIWPCPDHEHNRTVAWTAPA